MNLERPYAGKQDARIAWIHRNVRTTTVLIHKEHALPMVAAISRAEDTAFLLGTISVPEGARQHDVRILWIDGDVSDAAGFLEPHQFPGLAGVGRLINAGANRNVAADPSFTSTGPNNIWIRRSHCQRTDRRHRLAVKDWLPVN